MIVGSINYTDCDLDNTATGFLVSYIDDRLTDNAIAVNIKKTNRLLQNLKGLSSAMGI